MPCYPFDDLHNPPTRWELLTLPFALLTGPRQRARRVHPCSAGLLQASDDVGRQLPDGAGSVAPVRTFHDPLNSHDGEHSNA
jgi:hypothetical protein